MSINLVDKSTRTENQIDHVLISWRPNFSVVFMRKMSDAPWDSDHSLAKTQHNTKRLNDKNKKERTREAVTNRIDNESYFAIFDTNTAVAVHTFKRGRFYKGWFAWRLANFITDNFISFTFSNAFWGNS